jgi:hypothetical protein
MGEGRVEGTGVRLPVDGDEMRRDEGGACLRLSILERLFGALPLAMSSAAGLSARF